nr:GrBNV_gp28-like protein [Apis mellifera nudivirus]
MTMAFNTGNQYPYVLLPNDFVNGLMNAMANGAQNGTLTTAVPHIIPVNAIPNNGNYVFSNDKDTRDLLANAVHLANIRSNDANIAINQSVNDGNASVASKGTTNTNTATMRYSRQEEELAITKIMPDIEAEEAAAAVAVTDTTSTDELDTFLSKMTSPIGGEAVVYTSDGDAQHQQPQQQRMTVHSPSLPSQEADLPPTMILPIEPKDPDLPTLPKELPKLPQTLDELPLKSKTLLMNDTTKGTSPRASISSKPIRMNDPRMRQLVEDISSDEEEEDDGSDGKENNDDNEEEKEEMEDDKKKDESGDDDDDDEEDNDNTNNNNDNDDGGDDGGDDVNVKEDKIICLDSDTSSDSDYDNGKMDKKKQRQRKSKQSKPDDVEIINVLPTTLQNAVREKKMQEKIKPRISERNKKIEIISAVEQRMLVRPDCDFKILEPKTIHKVKIPKVKPMFRKPVACKFDKKGEPLYLDLPSITRYTDKDEAGTFGAQGQRAYPNDLVVGLSGIWDAMIKRPEFKKYAYIKQRGAVSSYGSILRDLSENLDACTFVHKVTNNITTDLTHYTLVYGAVPTDMINCTLEVIAFILAEYHSSRSKSTHEDMRFAPIKDGEIELLVFNYWQLSTQDLIHWNDQTPRLNLKRLLAYVWSLLPEDEPGHERLKHNIKKLAMFQDDRNRITAECMWYIKTHFISIITKRRNDSSYVNAWNYFMKQSKVHHYACFHTRIEMHMRVKNVAQSLRKQVIEITDAVCAGDMLTQTELKRILKRWVTKIQPNSLRKLNVVFNQVIFWSIQELTSYLVRNAHYPRSKTIDLGHMQGFLNNIHDRIPVNNITLMELIADSSSLRKIKSMLILQMSAYSPLQSPPKIADDAFELFNQFIRMVINYALLPVTYSGIPSNNSAALAAIDGEEDDDDDDDYGDNEDINLVDRIKSLLTDFLDKHTTDGRRYDTWSATSYNDDTVDKNFTPSSSDEDSNTDSDSSSENDDTDDDEEDDDDDIENNYILFERERKDLIRLSEVDFMPDGSSLPTPKPPRIRKKREKTVKPPIISDVPLKNHSLKLRSPTKYDTQVPIRPPKTNKCKLSKFIILDKPICRTKCVLCAAMTTIRAVEFIPGKLCIAVCAACIHHIEHNMLDNPFDPLILERRIMNKIKAPVMFKIVGINRRVVIQEDTGLNGKRVRVTYNRYERKQKKSKPATAAKKKSENKKSKLKRPISKKELSSSDDDDDECDNEKNKKRRKKHTQDDETNEMDVIDETDNVENPDCNE